MGTQWLPEAQSEWEAEALEARRTVGERIRSVVPADAAAVPVAAAATPGAAAAAVTVAAGLLSAGEMVHQEISLASTAHKLRTEPATLQETRLNCASDRIRASCNRIYSTPSLIQLQLIK